MRFASERPPWGVLPVPALAPPLMTSESERPAALESSSVSGSTECRTRAQNEQAPVFVCTRAPLSSQFVKALLACLMVGLRGLDVVGIGFRVGGGAEVWGGGLRGVI